MEKGCNFSGFVAMMIRRCQDSADTAFPAIMRRADNPNQCSAAWEFLTPYCDIVSDHQRLAFALVGSAIAREKPANDGSASIGQALRNICETDDDIERESRRLRRLIACGTAAELIPALRPILRYIQDRSRDIGYGRLLRDLLYWNEKTRIAWTRDFYRRDADSVPDEKEAR